MFKSYTLSVLLLLQFSSNAQLTFNVHFTEPDRVADTLYFPFENGVQLIVIDYYETWDRYVSFMEFREPRSMPWSAVLGPSPNNVYLFRNTNGEIVQSYNGMSDGKGLKGTDFVNTDVFSLSVIHDYNAYNKHLKFYDINQKMGLINLRGEVVVPAVYDEIRKYQDFDGQWDKMVIIRDGKFGLMDSNLNVLFPAIYQCDPERESYGYPEHNIINGQYIKVYRDGKCGLINVMGEILINLEFDNLISIHDSLIVGYTNKEVIDKNQHAWKNVQRCIVFDKSFKQIAAIDEYDQIEYNGIKRFIVKKDSLYGVVNHLGKVIIPLEYERLTPQEEVYYVTKNNKSGLISADGKILIPLKYEDSFYFYGQAIYVVENGLIGVYNDKYKLIVAPQFTARYWDMGKFMLVRPDGSKGFVLHLNGGSYYQSPEGVVVML